MGKISCYVQVVCLLFLFMYTDSSFSSPNSTILCNPEQSFALLQFKKATFSGYSPALCRISYHKTDSWLEATDCCSWDGVTCDNLTGNVVGLDLSCSRLQGILHSNSSLFHLPRLQSLNLAFNDFSSSSISSGFVQFRELTSLNLSGSGFSGLVPSEISQLSKLVSLDLTDYGSFRSWFQVEYEPLRFDEQNFVMLMQNLTRLSVLRLTRVNMSLVNPVSSLNLPFSMRILNLGSTGIQGKIPDDVFCLPNLQELYLFCNENLTGYLPKSNWSSPLKILYLPFTNFMGEIPDPIGNLRSLEKINFQGCHFRGSIPASIGNLTLLSELDFSSNNFSGQIPSSLSKLEQLTDFNSSANMLTGQIPDIFANLNKLTHLSLSDNNFSGKFPPSLFNLSNLSTLDISSNHLTGSFPYHVNGLGNLTSLDLANNILRGRVPSWLFTLPSLVSMKLSNNKLSGPINRFVFKLPNSLNEVYLGNNDINGSIPISIFELVQLTDLDLSSNNLSGTIDLDMLSKLKNLQKLDLSHNNLISFSANFNTSYTFPNLTSLTLSSCNFTEFPSFFRTLENLGHLDLSSNSIHGRISLSESSGWKSLNYLNLSHNFLTYIEQHPWQNIIVLDLRNNLLQGSLVIPPRTTTVLLVSDNKLTGQIPPSICNLSSIIFLDLSNNNLSGKIPSCSGNFSVSITMLHLGMNNLNGSIPDTFSYGSLLTSLDLNGNNLEGPLPRSLANSSKLEVVNVGNNKISDRFPCWLGTLPELKILILRSNKFYGSICDSKPIFSFLNLRIIDFSHNEFTSFLPRSFFKCLKAMMNMEVDEPGVQYIGGNYYQDSVTVAMKGREIEIKRIITIFTSIDLSSNQFQGEIPEVLGNFKSLIVLNLSQNSLTGNIPCLLGNSKALESLDLSSNKLDGSIPDQLKSLTFLAVLNLAHNQLSGPIPQGGQFYTYTNDSFIGNTGLCGEPLTVKCSIDGALQPPPPSVSNEEDDTTSGFDWKIMMMSYGCGLVIGLSIGYIVFTTGKPRWFVRKVEGKPRKRVRRPTQIDR